MYRLWTRSDNQHHRAARHCSSECTNTDSTSLRLNHSETLFSVTNNRHLAKRRFHAVFGFPHFSLTNVIYKLCEKCTKDFGCKY